MNEALIIADIAGEFEALERLVKHVSENCPIIGVGDLVDRGLRSNDVLSWFIKTKRANACRANHEHMMLDYLRKTHIYHRGVWLHNGGAATLRSYEDYPNGVPEEHLKWLEERPSHIWVDDKKCLVTHAPLHPMYSSPEMVNYDLTMDDPEFEMTPLWNRGLPIQRPYFQVFGHNSSWGLLAFNNENESNAWALCIDQSRRKVLTGLHWPSGEILTEPYEKIRNPLAGLPVAP